MRVALPVKNDSLEIFTNAGHTPFFAIYDVQGSGMFRQVKLVELRDNPRVNVEAEFGCSHEHGDEDHDHDSEEHRQEHFVLADLCSDCSEVLVKKACKNAASVFKERGIKVGKIPQEILQAEAAIQDYLQGQ